MSFGLFAPLAERRGRRRRVLRPAGRNARDTWTDKIGRKAELAPTL
jgi:hypothetical protein